MEWNGMEWNVPRLAPYSALAKLWRAEIDDVWRIRSRPLHHFSVEKPPRRAPHIGARGAASARFYRVSILKTPPAREENAASNAGADMDKERRRRRRIRITRTRLVGTTASSSCSSSSSSSSVSRASLSPSSSPSPAAARAARAARRARTHRAERDDEVLRVEARRLVEPTLERARARACARAASARGPRRDEHACEPSHLRLRAPRAFERLFARFRGEGRGGGPKQKAGRVHFATRTHVRRPSRAPRVRVARWNRRSAATVRTQSRMTDGGRARSRDRARSYLSKVDYLRRSKFEFDQPRRSTT